MISSSLSLPHSLLFLLIPNSLYLSFVSFKSNRTTSLVHSLVYLYSNSKTTYTLKTHGLILSFPVPARAVAPTCLLLYPGGNGKQPEFSLGKRTFIPFPQRKKPQASQQGFSSLHQLFGQHSLERLWIGLEDQTQHSGYSRGELHHSCFTPPNSTLPHPHSNLPYSYLVVTPTSTSSTSSFCHLTGPALVLFTLQLS